MIPLSGAFWLLPFSSLLCLSDVVSYQFLAREIPTLPSDDCGFVTCSQFHQVVKYPPPRWLRSHRFFGCKAKKSMAHLAEEESKISEVESHPATIMEEIAKTKKKTSVIIKNKVRSLLKSRASVTDRIQCVCIVIIFRLPSSWPYIPSKGPRRDTARWCRREYTQVYVSHSKGRKRKWVVWLPK